MTGANVTAIVVLKINYSSKLRKSDLLVSYSVFTWKSVFTSNSVDLGNLQDEQITSMMI